MPRALTTATVAIVPNYRENRLQQALFGWYALLWAVAAIAPYDRRDWFLENILAVLFVGTLVKTYRRFPFSDLSYMQITLFLTLHAIAAHYSYAQVPIGIWVRDLLHLQRNDFDRVVHFSFGALMAYPIRELLVRQARLRGWWVYFLPVVAVLGASAVYEIGESVVARLVDPNLGDMWLGTQGDTWDSQNDMAVACLGSILSMMITWWVVRRRNARNWS